MRPKAHQARCYCGESVLNGGPVDVVAICHCSDCKRWTGAPMPAFAAFKSNDISGLKGAGISINPGVTRWNCPKCGSPLAATFDYLPDQVYVPLGLIEDAGSLKPEVHCHHEQALGWLHLNDGLPRASDTGREFLRK